MLAKLRPRSAYDVMAALALFLVVAGGSAYAANTVFSTDIVDGEVKTPDIANLAVGGPQLKAQAVTTQKVKDNNLTGADLVDNTLTGTDVNESTLGQVPSALVGGHGRYAGRGSCNPQFAVYNTCAVVTLDIPPGLPRVHVTGVAVADQGSVAEPEANGRCRVATSRGSIPDSEVFVMVDTALELMPLTVVAITGPLSPGPVAFSVECNEEDPDISYRNVGVTAVVIAPN